MDTQKVSPDVRPMSENVRRLGYENRVRWSDGDNIIETWTESRVIDVNMLKAEKEHIESVIYAKEPPDQELIDIGRAQFRAVVQDPVLVSRLNDINKMLSHEN